LPAVNGNDVVNSTVSMICAPAFCTPASSRTAPAMPIERTSDFISLSPASPVTFVTTRSIERERATEMPAKPCSSRGTGSVLDLSALVKVGVEGVPTWRAHCALRSRAL